MANYRNRLHGIRSQLRPKFISSGSAGSRRVQRLPRMAPNASSAQREVLENADTFETRVTYSLSGYPRVHDHPELNLSLGSRLPLNRLTFLGTAPTHRRECLSSFSMWGAESGTSLSSGGTMGEVSDEVNVRTVLSSNRDVSNPAYHTLSGEGNFSEATRSNIVSHDEHSHASSSAAFTRLMDPLFEYKGDDGINYRFDATRDSPNLSQVHPYQSSASTVAGTFVYPVNTWDSQNSYRLNDSTFWCEAITDSRHGASSSSRGPCKRKLSDDSTFWCEANTDSRHGASSSSRGPCKRKSSDDSTFWCEANTDSRHGASSSSRGPCKRKSSALDSPFIGDRSVSSQSFDVPVRYNPAVCRSSSSSRQRTVTSSPSSISAFTSSSMGQNIVSLNALPEGLTGLEEPQFSQRRASLREIPDRHSEPLRTSWPFGTSMSDQVGRQCNQETGSTGSRGVEPEPTSKNLYPAYTRAMQIGNPSAQVHPWSSGRRIQEGAPFSNRNLMNAWFSDSLPSVDQFSGARGCPNDLGLNGRRENRSMQVTACHLDSRCSQNGFDQNRALSRVGQTAASNQGPYEQSIADGSNQNFSINGNSSETRNWMSYYCHPMAPVNPSPNSLISDQQVRSLPSLPPRVPHRLSNHPTWSTSILPSEAPASSSMIGSTVIGRSLSTALFRAQPLEPSVEHRNEGFQSADARMSPGLPLCRSRTYDDHRRHDISNGVAEQLLMLDATVLFGSQDQHSDWRLDVDNMSYEELLALEERIGNVSTGVTEDVLSEKLKRRKFSQVEAAASASQETEVKCSVCQVFNGMERQGKESNMPDF